jgi:hypothetical protein
MSILSQIVAELSRTDSQPRDWYGWATNQMGHAFSFMALAMLFAPWIAAALAVTKETADGIKTNNRQGWRDCATDLFFSLSGVALVAFPAWQIPVLIAVAAALIVGIVKRVRAA